MTKLSRLLLCVVLAGLTTAWAIAQDSDTDAKSKGEVRSITGCVTKGPSANEFLLTASDGSSWEVHNNNAIDLTSHLGHTIKVKGVVSNTKMHNMKEDAKGAAKDAGMKNNKTEHGHLKVTDVRMVSESCQQ
jgi:hypothetical protein